MADAAIKSTPLARPERQCDVVVPEALGDVEQTLPLTERLWNSTAIRRLIILILLAGLWEAYARWSNNPLLFPTFTDTVEAWWHGIISDRKSTRLNSSH